MDQLVGFARRAHGSGEARSNFVLALGVALAVGELRKRDLMQLRLVLSETPAESEHENIYLRALIDVVRAAEAGRTRVEEDARVDRILADPERARVLTKLAASPAGPMALAGNQRARQSSMSRLLASLEEDGLVAPTEVADARGRPRELTALGYHAVRRLEESVRARSSSKATGAEIQPVVAATVRCLAAVRMQRELSDENALALAAREKIPRRLLPRFLESWFKAAEEHLFVDRDQQRTLWGAIQHAHQALLSAVRATPQRWDDAVGAVLQSRKYLVVGKDPDGWMRVLRSSKRPPEQVLSPSGIPAALPELQKELGPMALVFDDASIARSNPVPGVTSLIPLAARGTITFEELTV